MIHDLTMFTLNLGYFIMGSWMFVIGAGIIIATVLLLFKWVPKWKKRIDDKLEDLWK